MQTEERTAFKQTPSPFWPEIPDSDINALIRSEGIDSAVELLEQREQALEQAELDPLSCGFELECWKEAREQLGESDELLLLGGNRAGKTEFAAKAVVEVLCSKPNAVVWCLHSSLPSSIELQQPVVRKFLPPHWREMGKKGAVANVSFTAKNGFSEQVFVLPNGSRCRFLNYTQDIKVLEGGECDAIWCDELVSLDWIETLRFRIVTRKGKLLITFTPIKGYSMTVKDYVAGSKVLKSRPSELLPDNINVPGCPPGHMPYVLQPYRKNARVVTFFSEDNPAGGYDMLRKMLDGKPSTEIKIRAYGWADKLEGKTFAKFDETVHVVPPEKIPTSGTRYCACDPAGTKNWFIKWYIIDELNRAFIYREWPDRQTYGEWALPSDKPDGKPGPAQTAEQGRGLVGYKRLILELEGNKWDPGEGWDFSKGESIVRRIMDPRMGGAEVPSAEEPTSIISNMSQDHEDESGIIVGPSMIWEKGSGAHIDEGIQAINDWLDYDEDADLSVLNSPRLFVSSECEQSIYAFHEYTGRDGLKGALKDVVDPDRYFIKSDPAYENENADVTAGGGGY